MMSLLRKATKAVLGTSVADRVRAGECADSYRAGRRQVIQQSELELEPAPSCCGIPAVNPQKTTQ